MNDLTRDPELGAALRELDVPEHRPRFHAAVESDLVAEQVRRRRTTRRPRRRLGNTAPHRQSRGRVLALRVGAVAAVLGVTVSVLLVGGPRETLPMATAAEVRQQVAAAWASANSVSGRLVVSNPALFGSGARRWDFVLTAQGDMRLTDTTRGGDVAYDAERNVQRSLMPSESVGDDNTLFASVRKGLAPGWPDQGPSYDLLDRNLGSVVRAIAGGGGGAVEEVTYKGREAWLLDTDIRVNLIVPDASPNHLTVTVDRTTGFPLRVVARNDGRRLWVTRIEDLHVNASVEEDTFRLAFPPEVEVFRSDAGFRRVALNEVEERVGYAPLVPGSLPRGFELAEVAVSNNPSPTGTEGGNPPARDVVSLAYRRGLDRLLVTTRPVGDDPSRWSDPLATGEGFVDRPERVRFDSGALQGERGELLIDPLAIPHVWGIGDGLVVTVSGDADRAQLLQVAGSLQRR